MLPGLGEQPPDQLYPAAGRLQRGCDKIADGRVAAALFFERGYERTTVNDVIAKVGISKGGFYHHFMAKEDLLEAITVRLAQDAVARVHDILDDPGLSALERLNAYVALSRELAQVPA